MKIHQEYAKIKIKATLRNFGMKTLFLLSYFLFYIFKLLVF